MTRDKLTVMDGGKCILQLRGVRPFLSEKYDLTKHPNYSMTADADSGNRYDPSRQRDSVRRISGNKLYEVIDLDRDLF